MLIGNYRKNRAMLIFSIAQSINIVKFGSEDISSILSQSEILKILNRKMCSIEESIKLIHFNEKRPHLKNIYITIFMYKALALYINVNWEW